MRKEIVKKLHSSSFFLNNNGDFPKTVESTTHFASQSQITDRSRGRETACANQPFEIIPK